eukprot:CAMPEP_0171184912 /NCGR_PEP_ID=MMETSP0790-20130122/16027_1 /TAXON_ID=2925 /ORGANISM="Alexandrium catenella, Strain OF101" /LENGTH=785 /DNA_ID=CAMNT_0011649911 /DNA_START=56 /DNA_END=2410 /DNA_ORIENTATION=-
MVAEAAPEGCRDLDEAEEAPGQAGEAPEPTEALEVTSEELLEATPEEPDEALEEQEKTPELELEETLEELGAALEEPAFEDPEQTLEEKLDSFLQDEDLSNLWLSDPDAAAVSTDSAEEEDAVGPQPAGAPAAPDGSAAERSDPYSVGEQPDAAPAARSGGLAEGSDPYSIVEAAAAPVLDLTEEGEGGEQPAAPLEASLAEMATLALQLEAIRAMQAGLAPAVGAGKPDRGGEAASVARVAGVKRRATPSAQRWKLQRSIFRALDQDGDGRLSCTELMPFAVLAGFDGSEEDWTEDFADLCETHAGGDEGGPTLPCFRAMLDDLSKNGFYCKDEELAGLYEKIQYHEKNRMALPVAPKATAPSTWVIPEDLLTPAIRVPEPEPWPMLVTLDSPEPQEPAPTAQEEPEPEHIEEDAGPLDYDVSTMLRRDEPEVIDVEEMLREAWEERVATGEKLADPDGEDEVVETWGDADPHLGRGKSAPAPRTPHQSQYETEATEVLEALEDRASERATEVGTMMPPDHETEMATELVADVDVATEVVESLGSKRKLPGGSAVIQPPAPGDESTVLDALLVQAGVAHLAECDVAAEPRERRPSQQDVGSQGPQGGNSERPAKSARRGALRAAGGGGGAAARAPATPVEADSRVELRQELIQLGTRESMRDRRAIPGLAGRIATVHLPALGTATLLGTMADAFKREDVPRPHKLAILYVFHEMLLANCHRADFVADAAKHFLEGIGQTVARVPPDKLGPFIKLIGMWAHVYTDRYLRHLKGAWTSVVRSSVRA